MELKFILIHLIILFQKISYYTCIDTETEASTLCTLINAVAVKVKFMMEINLFILAKAIPCIML